jgi:sporulation protein YlmC with PRC-barrel domain
MRLKELHGLPVIDPTAAHKIGSVVDYQVDPTSGRLAALDVSGAEDGVDERVVAARIRRVGRSAVILTARGGGVSGPEPEVNDQWLDSSTLVGLDVMGDDGERVGEVLDASFNQDTLEVDAYVLRSDIFQRLTGRADRIVPARVHSCSRELMMVARANETAPAATEPALEATTTVTTGVALKGEDRLPAPSFDQVPDGKAISVH